MVIATRILKIHDRQDITIPVRLFAPKIEADDWSCSFEIDWPDGTIRRNAIGVDAVQALCLALQMIGTNLYISDLHETGALMWLAPGKGYGFPVPAIIRDKMIGDDKADT